MTIEVSQNKKTKTPYDQLVFGRTFTDHMLEIDWDVTTGWHSPRIIPYGNLSISPAATGLHYGIEVLMLMFDLLSSLFMFLSASKA